MKSIKVSVIIPVYRVEEYLSQCIDSVMGQSYRNIEIILVDDGSTDSCPIICDRYGAMYEQIKVIHKLNSGVSDSRNVGLEQADGDYILFIDSDDFLSDNTFLECAVDLIKKQEVDLLVFGNNKLYEDGTREKDSLNCDANTFVGNITEICSMGCFKISVWGKIVKSEILKKNHIVFRKGVRGEDMEWCAKIIQYCDSCAILNTYPYEYRQWYGSATKNLSEKTIMDVKNNFIHCLGIRDKVISDKRRAMNIYLSQNLSMFMIAISTMPKIVKKQYYKFIRQNLDYLTYSVRSREKIIYLFAKIFGIMFTERLLGVANKLRRIGR